MSDVTPTPEQSPAPDDFLARILDQIVDLAQTARDWVRQEAEATVKEKIVPPLQKVGLAIASAFAAASLLFIGLIFVAVAAIEVYLSQLLGVPLAFFIIGAVYLAGAGIHDRESEVDAAMNETTGTPYGLSETAITLDDIRHKALRIRDEVKDEVTEVVADRGSKMILVGVVAVLAVVGIAYLAGTLAGRRAAEPPLY